MDELQELGRLIKRAQWQHHRLLDSRLRSAAGITIVQWDALRAIEREPGASARRLAAETFQSEQSFGVMASGMERRGLIVRTRGQGRAHEHRVTDEGRRMLGLGSAFATEVLQNSVGRLDARQRSALRELLETVLDDERPD
jgi:DNA-binding MarR family transcriptional regulator